MNPESPIDQAAHWAARLDGGPLNREDAEALTCWLDADPENESRLNELQSLHCQVRDVMPGMAETQLRPLREKRREGFFPGWAWTSAMVAVVVLTTLCFVQRPTSYETAKAQRQSVTFTDGTNAELNARTSLKVRMRGTERQVTLERGEVFFSVAKDAARPFQVETAAGSIRVTGTVFNVSSYEAGSLEVVLLEGAVELTAENGAMRRMNPGERARLAGGHIDVAQMSAAELAGVVAWREGHVLFQETAVAEAARRFSDYHGCTISVASEVKALALGGRFELDDLEGFLRDLEVALPVRVKREAQKEIRIEAAPRGEK